MYRVLLVDDERPALNYLDAILRKYLPDFQVCATAESAAEAWNTLNEQQVDVLITDISMPGEMNGIDLAKKARSQFPALPIVIVSGYAEFEYARGALQAGVEDYLLKPISIGKVKEVMEHVKARLDQRHTNLIQETFASLMAQKEIAPELLERCFGRTSYYFAIVRFGNLTNTRFSRAIGTARCQLTQPNWLAFYGHDENELILLLPSSCVTGRFSAALSALIEGVADGRAYTAIYDSAHTPIRLIHTFLEKAFSTLNSNLIIGRSQLLPVQTKPATHTDTLPSGIRKQLSSLMNSGSWQAVKELFLSLAVEWEQIGVPQDQLEGLCFQLIHLIVGEAGPSMAYSMQALTAEATGLFGMAASMGELLTSLYGILFGDVSSHDKKVSGEELCEYTLRYIRENYALPLNIQSVCAKIGFSQTYLSRLLRKYADTTVNTYLTQCRIEAAKDLLRANPDMLLRDVAASVGYDDQSYFNKIFRSETGMTPKQFATGQQK